MGKKTKKSKGKLSFKEAVEQTPDISHGYREGLSALGDDSKRVIIPDTIRIDGSVDIDKETVHLYPSDNRWDYAFACEGKVYYVEVHSAITSEVRTVINKLIWLKQWLASRAPELVRLTNYGESPFYWIQSSSFQISKHHQQYKMAISKKIKPIRVWDYNTIVKKKG